MNQELLKAAISKDVHDVCVIERLHKEGPELLRGKTAQGNTALHLAIKFGNNDFAARIHRLCPDLLGWQNVNGETSLHCAATCGWPYIWHWAVNVINTMNADNNDEAKRTFRKSNRHGETALHVALKNDNEIMAKSLLNADSGLSDCINNAGESIIYLAANFGYLDIVKKLLQSPSTANHTGLLGRSPLHAAIRAGNIDVVEAILKERSGDIKRRDKNGSTPLHYAVSLNHVRLVEILLPCDPSAAYDVDLTRNSPAHIAAQMGFIEVLDEILSYCPDCIDVVDAKGRNILHVAADSGKLHVAKHILACRELRGVVNQQDVNGDMPLHVGSSKCEAEVLKQLIVDNRSNRRIENYEGQMDIESLPREADEDVYLKYVEASRVLLHTGYSKDDAITAETHGNRISDTSGRLFHSVDAQRKKTISKVAALIVTVTFTFVFAVPDGYFQGGPDQGLAILTKKSNFKAFVVCDTLGLMLSLRAIILVTSIKEWARNHYLGVLALAEGILAGSFSFVMAAFAFGVPVVVAPLSPHLGINVGAMFDLFVSILVLALTWQQWIYLSCSTDKASSQKAEETYASS